MRLILQEFMLLSLVAAGCSSHTIVTYRTAIRIAPASEAGFYDVEASVLRQTMRTSSSPFHSRTSTHSDVVSGPRMKCRPAEPARATIAADDNREALVLDAYIAKAAEGRESICTLTVRQQGQVVSATEVRVPALSP